MFLTLYEVLMKPHTYSRAADWGRTDLQQQRVSTDRSWSGPRRQHRPRSDRSDRAPDTNPNSDQLKTRHSPAQTALECPAIRPLGPRARPQAQHRADQGAAARSSSRACTSCRARDQGPLRAPLVEGIKAKAKGRQSCSQLATALECPASTPGHREQQQDAGPGTKVRPCSSVMSHPHQATW